MSAPICTKCRHVVYRGLRGGPGCARTTCTRLDPVTGPYENMRRCEAERSEEGALLDRLFRRRDRLPCGPGGRHFEPKP